MAMKKPFLCWLNGQRHDWGPWSEVPVRGIYYRRCRRCLLSQVWNDDTRPMVAEIAIGTLIVLGVVFAWWNPWAVLP